MFAIEMNSVTKSYDDFCLENLNLKLPSGTIMGLIGENGAGKTTTMKLIMGAIAADSGEIKVLGTNNTDASFIELKQSIGIVQDEAHFPEVLNAIDIGRILKCTYKDWDEKLYYSYIKQFKLPEKKAVNDYSRGMTMKLALAGALSHNAKLLIMDEATGGLDPVARDNILEILNEYTRDENKSVLFSSHIISDLEKICDYIAYIKDGKLLFCEEKDIILERYARVKLDADSYSNIPKAAIKGTKRRGYGYELLVDRMQLDAGYQFENTTLEDIVVFFSN